MNEEDPHWFRTVRLTRYSKYDRFYVHGTGTTGVLIETTPAISNTLEE